MKIGFIGGGKMGEAIIASLVGTETVAKADIRVSDVRPERLELLRDGYGIGVSEGNAALAAWAEVLFVAVKPQDLNAMLTEIGPSVSASHLVISIAAGKRLAGIDALLPQARVVRVMPNVAALVGEGMSAFCLGVRATDEDRGTVLRLLSSFGKAVELPEELFDAVTALSGSGPAFVAYYLAQMIDAGVKLGLPPEEAGVLGIQTLLGTAQLLDNESFTPASLVKAVMSPKGTTEAGFGVLWNSDLPDIVHQTLAAAAARSRELSA
jgi:pyrroline-5-carboxylate reductase